MGSQRAECWLRSTKASKELDRCREHYMAAILMTTANYRQPENLPLSLIYLYICTSDRRLRLSSPFALSPSFPLFLFTISAIFLRRLLRRLFCSLILKEKELERERERERSAQREKGGESIETNKYYISIGDFSSSHFQLYVQYRL